MPVLNVEIADILEKVADLLEIEDANPFRVRAYRNAARTIKELPRSVRSMLDAGEDLTQLSGIGEDLAGKIEEIVETGGLKQLEKLKQRTPAELVDLLDVSGLGPKRVARLHTELGIDTLEDLEAAAAQDRIVELHGFGEKTQERILNDVQEQGKEKRTRLDIAEQAAKPLSGLS